MSTKFTIKKIKCDNLLFFLAYGLFLVTGILRTSFGLRGGAAQCFG